MESGLANANVNKPTSVGDSVLARFDTKRTVCQFVGQVAEVIEDEFSIKFLRCIDAQ